MLMRHRALWQWIEQFINEHQIHSVLEIGPGLVSPVGEWVKHYYAIDVNTKTDAAHADFTQINVRSLPHADLLLAANVIEHCPSYEPFLLQAKMYCASYTIVSFFNRIWRDDNHIRKCHSKVYKNRYSKKRIEQWLEAQKWPYQWHVLARNSIVLLLEKP